MSCMQAIAHRNQWIQAEKKNYEKPIMNRYGFLMMTNANKLVTTVCSAVKKDNFHNLLSWSVLSYGAFHYR